MNKKDKIEIARSILNNAVNINISQDIILKISQKLDKYIVDYYLNNDESKDWKKGSSSHKTDSKPGE